MFCPNCGKELSDLADICVGCGRSVKNLKSTASDSASAGWWWLGFFFPLIGFILWAIWSGNYPMKAKKAGIGAIVGTITSVVLFVLFYVLIIIIIILSADSGNMYYY